VAKSKAKKQREHLIRQGKYDPSISRGSWFGVKPITKVKPNKRKDYYDDEYNRGHKLLCLGLYSLSL